jgi:hypothetical protein
MDNAPEYKQTERKDTVGELLKQKQIIHRNIPKRAKEYNGKIENTNRHIDYELLPLIYTAKD